MELRPDESGCSTLCILGTDLSLMSENDFISLLQITAVQNQWPKLKHNWRSGKAKNVADNYFEKFRHERLTHPCFKHCSYKPDKKETQHWAQTILLKLEEILSNK